jgi:predicted ATPase
MRRSGYEQIPLAPLDRATTSELLADLLGDDPSCDGLGELIQELTEGNPFYIEEVVQGLIEAGSLQGCKGAYRVVQSIAQITIPPSVEAALAARIDRLGGRNKAVLQTAAVIGREFSASVLRGVVELPEAALGESLRALIEAEFLYERPEPPHLPPRMESHQQTTPLFSSSL